MTNDLPDALIEKVARAICESSCVVPACNPSCKDCFREAKAALTALDLSGIISDLRFYGSPNTWRIYDNDIMTDFEDDKGQRARTRLSSLGITNNGGNNEK